MNDILLQQETSRTLKSFEKQNHIHLLFLFISAKLFLSQSLFQIQE